MAPGSQSQGAGDRRFMVSLRYTPGKANMLDTLSTHLEKVTLLRHDLLALKLPHPRAENVQFGPDGLAIFSWTAPTNGVLHRNLMRINPPPQAQRDHDRLLRNLSIAELTLEELPIHSRNAPHPNSPQQYKKPQTFSSKRPYPYDTDGGGALKFPKQEQMEPVLSFNPPRPESISSSRGPSQSPDLVSTEFLKSVLDSINRNAAASAQGQRRPDDSWSHPPTIPKKELVTIDLSFSPPLPQNHYFLPASAATNNNTTLQYTPAQPLEMHHSSSNTSSSTIVAQGPRPPINSEPYIPAGSLHAASMQTPNSEMQGYDPAWSMNRPDSSASHGWADIPDYWGHWQHQAPPSTAQSQNHTPSSASPMRNPGDSPYSLYTNPLPRVGYLPSTPTNPGYNAPTPSAAFPRHGAQDTSAAGPGLMDMTPASVSAPQPTKPPLPPGYIPSLLDSLKSHTQPQQSQSQTQEQSTSSSIPGQDARNGSAGRPSSASTKPNRWDERPRSSARMDVDVETATSRDPPSSGREYKGFVRASEASANVNGYPRGNKENNDRGRDYGRELNSMNGHRSGSGHRSMGGSANSSGGGSVNGGKTETEQQGDPALMQKLTRELWDVRRHMKTEVAREKKIIEELRKLGAEPVAESSLEKDLCVMRAKVQLLESALENERKRKKEAEDALEDVKRECTEPFVVPALLDAFVALSKLTTQLGDAKGKGGETSELIIANDGNGVRTFKFREEGKSSFIR